MIKVYKFVCPFHGLIEGKPIKIETEDEKTKKLVDGVQCPFCEVKRKLNECEIIEEKT